MLTVHCGVRSARSGKPSRMSEQAAKEKNASRGGKGIEALCLMFCRNEAFNQEKVTPSVSGFWGYHFSLGSNEIQNSRLKTQIFLGPSKHCHQATLPQEAEEMFRLL